MKNKKLTIRILMGLLVVCMNTAYAQILTIAPNVGLSKGLGDGSGFSTFGYTIGANVFYRISDHISVGGRLAYNYLSPNVERIAGLFGRQASDYAVESTSGHFSMVEVVPSVRIAIVPPNKSREANLAFQMGAGLYFLEVDASASGVRWSGDNQSKGKGHLEYA